MKLRHLCAMATGLALGLYSTPVLAVDITEYTIPTPNSAPTSIVADPDGNFWFTEFSGNKIGKITPAGVITEFPVPTRTAVPLASRLVQTATSGLPRPSATTLSG